MEPSPQDYVVRRDLTIGCDYVTRRGPDLDLFSQTLYPWQALVKGDALALETGTGTRRLYAVPTGTGKGSCELSILRDLRKSGLDAWILTPSLEVMRGFVERCGAVPAQTSEGLAKQGAQIFVSTPTRFRNRILDGTRAAPEYVIYDETHHCISGNEVSGTLLDVAPRATWVGFTATPYRGTAKGTQALREVWGEPYVVLTIPEAVEAGYCSLPTFSVVPLLDDDQVRVSGGRFTTTGKTGTDALVSSRLSDLAQLVKGLDRKTRPTCVVVPSRAAAGLLVEELDRIEVDAYMVIASTSTADRAAAYMGCRAGAVLVCVAVLTEGVDLPWLRRLVDARPTMSPVAWVQQIGRIMRPGPVRPEYICVTRNLERHSYLLHGAVPRSKVAEAQAAFEKPSKRAGRRSVGLESLGKFKPIRLPLDHGVWGTMFALYTVDSDTGKITEYVTLLDPTHDAPICAQRTVGGETGARQYGTWRVAPMSANLAGFATSRFRGDATVKQRAWWERAARRHGLDPSPAKLSRRQFSALPVLVETGRHMLGGGVS